MESGSWNRLGTMIPPSRIASQPRPNVAVSMVVAVAIALSWFWLLGFSDRSPSGGALMLLSLAAVAVSTWYSVQTVRRLANDRPTTSGAQVARWAFALLAFVINSFVMLMATGVAIIVLFNRPIVP